MLQRNRDQQIQVVLFCRCARMNAFTSACRVLMPGVNQAG
ncbi:hypothetical protein ACS15_4998 [Ralstonia insidiosa]|uniref:Uncharacterized protein n=1 Tax=Ralstonia insidiosa TaxID=190721 RepID=A0AAC9BMN9_9RALS|nr:hypothetical protein ACS15_4998 [Ralstonia insidiosa]